MIILINNNFLKLLVNRFLFLLFSRYVSIIAYLENFHERKGNSRDERKLLFALEYETLVKRLK